MSGLIPYFSCLSEVVLSECLIVRKSIIRMENDGKRNVKFLASWPDSELEDVRFEAAQLERKMAMYTARLTDICVQSATALNCLFRRMSLRLDTGRHWLGAAGRLGNVVPISGSLGSVA
jgi:hypothetical protein